MNIADAIASINHAAKHFGVKATWSTTAHGNLWAAEVRLGEVIGTGVGYEEPEALANAIGGAVARTQDIKKRDMTLTTALAAIDAAVETSSKTQGASPETLKALRFLWRYSDKPDFRDALVWFKESLDGPNYIGRFQNANASRNRIRLLSGVGRPAS